MFDVCGEENLLNLERRLILYSLWCLRIRDCLIILARLVFGVLYVMIFTT